MSIVSGFVLTDFRTQGYSTALLVVLRSKGDLDINANKSVKGCKRL